MVKLFRGYFSRLGKWSIFRIMIVVMIVGSSAAAIGLRDNPMLFNAPYILAYLIFPHYVGVIIGLFNYPLFTNGAIRNQIIVGHKRTHIYIADWAASTAFSVMTYLIAVLFLLTVGALAGDTSGIAPKAVASGIVLSTLHIILFATITQLFCVIFKGVKSFLVIYLGNQLLILAAVGASMVENIPKVLYYFLPTAVCMQLDSYDTAENLMAAELGVEVMSFSFLPAAAVMLLEIGLVFTAGLLYFRKTDIN